jgi:ABC-type glycerol-3-phosphate transport system substrate-binding protein
LSGGGLGGDATNAGRAATNNGVARTSGDSAGKADVGSGGSSSKPSGPPLRMLVVDDPDFAREFDREWRTISDEPLEIRNVASGELGATMRLPPGDGVVFSEGLLGTLAESRQIVPLPAAFWDSDRLARRDLLETARKREAFWGQQPYAVPLGSNMPVFLYRQDLFEALQLNPPRDWQEFQVLADRLRSRPELPQSEAASTNRKPGESEEAWHGVLEPLAPGSAAITLLVRAAAYVRHPNQYSTLFDIVTMAPRIDSPPFIRALEELQAAHAMNPGPALERDIHAVRRELLAGRAAAAICWPLPAATASAGEGQKTDQVDFPPSAEGRQSGTDTARSAAREANQVTDQDANGDAAEDAARGATKDATENANGDTRSGNGSGIAVRAVRFDGVGEAGWMFGVAAVPGATVVFNADQRKWEARPEGELREPVPVWAISGRLGGVMATSRRGGAAANLLALVATADWGRKVLAKGPRAGVSRLTQLERPDDWVDSQLAGEPARQFAKVVANSQRLPAWMAVPRIPGRDRYLTALDEAVRKAVRGERSVAECLEEAATAWRGITDELGRDAQKKAYRRCLGIEP